MPDLPGVDEVPYLTNTSILGLDEVPRHLVVVGGSYIGLEFAQMYRRFGADVTVVEKGPRLIAREDEDVSAAVRTILEDEGITVRTGRRVHQLSPHGDGIAVRVDCDHGRAGDRRHARAARRRTPAEHRRSRPRERAGVTTDARGYITVDDQLAPRACPASGRIGDCNGRGAFTHTAYNDFEIVAANLLDGETRRVSDRIPATRSTSIRRSAASA